MPARITLSLLALVAAMAVPATAQALHSVPSGTLSRIDGTTAYAQVHDHLVARDLSTGRDQTFALPDNYAVWNDAPVAAHGLFAGVAAASGSMARVFTTGPAGINYVSSSAVGTGHCSTSPRSLEIRAGGGVIVLELVKQSDVNAHCSVDTAATRLRLYSRSGDSKDLWLPARYAKWLRTGSASMRGDRIIVSRPGTTKVNGRFVVLDVFKQKVIAEYATGKHFVDATFTAKLGALARYRDNARVAARHFSFYLPKSRTIYRGKRERIFVCGNRTLVAGIGSVKMIGLHRNTLFQTSRKGDYDYSSIVCSDQLVAYTLEPNVPAMGEAPDLPPAIHGVLDLTKFFA